MQDIQLDDRKKILVSVLMGSRSDWSTMQYTTETLASLNVAHEVRIVSTHRTPNQLFEYVKQAVDRGIEMIIAGAGGTANLPGMLASKTSLPVLGVPVKSKTLNSIDSLLPIAQMPAEVPVGTLTTGQAGAINAALLAASTLGNKYPKIRRAIADYHK